MYCNFFGDLGCTGSPEEEEASERQHQSQTTSYRTRIVASRSHQHNKRASVFALAISNEKALYQQWQQIGKLFTFTMQAMGDKELVALFAAYEYAFTMEQNMSSGDFRDAIVDAMAEFVEDWGFRQAVHWEYRVGLWSERFPVECEVQRWSLFNMCWIAADGRVTSRSPNRTCGW